MKHLKWLAIPFILLALVVFLIIAQIRQIDMEGDNYVE